MWAYRRIIKITGISRITNREVLHRLGNDTLITNIIKIRKRDPVAELAKPYGCSTRQKLSVSRLVAHILDAAITSL